MYDLAVRWKRIQVTTPDTLGPNHYDLQERLPLPNRVPFLSSRPRKSELGQPSYCNTFYSIKNRSRIIGGSSLKSKSKRVTLEIKDSVSPATYDPKFNEKKSFRVASAPLVKGKKLYVCRVPYTLGASAPSIPTKLDANGYDYDKNGRLVKIPVEEIDESKKTIFYDISNGPCLTTRLYKGCRWSISKTQRSELATIGGPGPAAYDARYKKIENDRDEYVREMARLYSFQPRYLDMVQTQISRNDYPGPGSYELSKPLGCNKSLSLNPIGFGSRSERPGMDQGLELSEPAKFDLRKSILKRSVSIKDVPFNFDCFRFPTKKVLVTPGPGQYSPIGDGIEANLERAMCSLTDSTPPFNQSAERNTMPVSSMTANPAPNQYGLEKTAETALCQGSVFKSVTGRFEDTKRFKSAEPATYSVSEPFNRSRNRKSHNAGSIPFQANEPRRTFIVSSITPDPCKYTSYPTEIGTKGYTFNRCGRFEIPDESPGPANYMIPSSTDKVAKTFNLRLKEQVVRSKLRLAPHETKEAFLAEIKKHKQLSVFYRPPQKSTSWLNFRI